MVRQGDEYDPGLVLLDEVIWASMSDEQRQRYLIEIGAIPPDPFPEPSVGLFQQVTSGWGELPADPMYLFSERDAQRARDVGVPEHQIMISPPLPPKVKSTPVPNRAARRKAARRQ